MLDLIVSVPDHCFSFLLSVIHVCVMHENGIVLT